MKKRHLFYYTVSIFFCQAALFYFLGYFLLKKEKNSQKNRFRKDLLQKKVDYSYEI